MAKKEKNIIRLSTRMARAMGIMNRPKTFRWEPIEWTRITTDDVLTALASNTSQDTPYVDIPTTSQEDTTVTTNQESIMPTTTSQPTQTTQTTPKKSKAKKSKSMQAMEYLAAYPETTPEELVTLLDLNIQTARTLKFRASGKLPSRVKNSKYSRVREYVMAHPRTSVDTIAKKCGCSTSYVHYLMNPTTGPLAAEFGDIRHRHMHKTPKALPLVIPHAEKAPAKGGLNVLAPAKPVTVITPDPYFSSGHTPASHVVPVTQPQLPFTQLHPNQPIPLAMVSPAPAPSKAIPLTDPTNKYARMTMQEATQREMVKLLRKDSFGADDLKALGSLFLALSSLLRVE